MVAIVPAVANAPWEDEVPVVGEDGTNVVRCDGALSLRASVIAAGEYSMGARAGSIQVIGEPLAGNTGGLRDYAVQLAKADREINRYC